MGSLREGRAAVSQTGPGQGPRNLSLRQLERVAQGRAVPTLLPAPFSGFPPRPSWGVGGSALPRG